MIQSHTIVESHLTRCDNLCRQWASLQTTTLTLFSSITNITTQRQETQTTIRSLANRPTNDMLSQLLSNGNLDRLLYKQTRAMEESIRQLHACMPKFRALVVDLDRLLAESTKHLSYTLTNPSSIDKPSATIVTVAAIDPADAHAFVSQIACMYARELAYKQTLLETLPAATTSVQTLEELGRRWTQQPNVDFEVEEEMSERVKLYKKIKEAAEKGK
ncbi:hypothetical protein BC938DRAFT_475962 [Jimgerdemannia flammicorona]|uniref:Uncharacterized protein n=1 Tax=Jimgerdemannia flammicorona TaxID=994334 RepID=A0A433PLZ9_9FUNG|nr:hypothetical protein BC938DRAFT_475962 [Jimgerdemannia flammicorona]